MYGVRGILLGAALLVSAGAVGSAQADPCRDACGGLTIESFSNAVEVALGNAEACTGLDGGGDGIVAVDDLIALVEFIGQPCPEASPTPTATATESPTVAQTLPATPTETHTSEPTPTATQEVAGPIIFTLAGNGIAGLNGDGMATESSLYLPQDVTVGPDGRVYVVDWNNHRIRRIEEDLTLKTIAGTGVLGDAQDGYAGETNFNHPTNVEFDHEGRLLIAAWHNSLVKKMDLVTTLVTNVAGDGSRAFCCDEGPANSAKLDLPSSVAVNSSGEIFISDQANYRIRMVDAQQFIHTVAGNGTPGYSGDGGQATMAQLNSPRGQSAPPAGRLTVDSNNRILLADSGNHVIRMIDVDGTIDTIVGNGTAGYSGDGEDARFAQLDTPSDVAVGADGTLYIADTMNSVIRYVTPEPDRKIYTLAGTGVRGFSGDGAAAKLATLDRPYGLTVATNPETQMDDVYVADTHNQRIRKIVLGEAFIPPTPAPTPTPEIIPCTGVVGSICTYAGTGGTGFSGDGQTRLQTVLYWPFDMEFLTDGRRILLDWNNHKVREILDDDTLRTLVGTDFVGDGPPDLSDLDLVGGADGLAIDLNHPTDIQEMPDGDILFVAWHNHKLRMIDKGDGRVRVIFGLTPGGFPMPGDGVIAKNARANQPSHAVLHPSGHLFFIDQRNQRIRVLKNFATLRENAIVAPVVGSGVRGFNGDGLATNVQLNFPTGGNPEPGGGIALDPQGRLWFADSNNHRIRRVDFFDPTFTDDNFAGTVSTVAGTGEAAYGGDDGPPLEAKLNFPNDMEFGPDGNLYFVDTNNNRVRLLDFTSGKIVTVAGTGEKGYGGDAGPATEAKLNRPFGVAFDAEGDLYVSDTFNSRVRKIER
jgi:sugar lactone lactonase YvrE